MASPRHQRARAFKTLRRTAGNVTITTTAINVDTALDIALSAQVGDVIEYSVNGRVTPASGSDASFDVATIVSAAPVNYMGAGLSVGGGVQGWYMYNTAVSNLSLTGSAWYTIVIGDLASGIVTLRLRGIGGGTGAHVLQATAASPFMVCAKNLGPVSPH